MVSHFAVLPRFPDRALEGVDDVNSGLDCPGVVRKCVGFGVTPGSKCGFNVIYQAE